MLSRISTRFLITAVASVALAVAVPVAALAAGGHKGHASGKKGHADHMMGSKHAKSHGHHGKSHHAAMGHHGMHKGMVVLNDSLAPSMPEDPTLHGVAPGAKPWVLSKGDVRLKADGKLVLHVKGLIIPELGTAGPVEKVMAALYCGESEEAAAMSKPVMLSEKGDARIFEKSFKAPSTCLAPVVLLETEAAGMSMYIAASGW